MREILFRGKRRDNSEWSYGSLQCFKGYSIFDTIWKNFITVNSKTVGQYIGLTDKNGVKIFEDDICKFREWNRGDMCWIGKVVYEHQQFVISGGPNEECDTPFILQMSRFIPENIEIIGNIHDNPELLKE